MEEETISNNIFDDVAQGGQQGSGNFAPEVEPEPVEPEAEQEPEQQEPIPTVDVAIADAKPQPKKEMNFEVLRERQEKLEVQHSEALNRLRQYELAAKQEVQPEREDYPQDIDIGDDELFEGKHYKTLQKQLKQQREDLNAYHQQVQATTTETRLRSQFSDFDQVLTAENIEALKKNEPELSSAISSTQDLYTKAVSTYKMIKKLGIYVEDNFEADRELVKKNSLKPKPLASVSPQASASPLSQANAFANGKPTKEALDRAYKEMESCRGGYL